LKGFFRHVLQKEADCLILFSMSASEEKRALLFKRRLPGMPGRHSIRFSREQRFGVHRNGIACDASSRNARLEAIPFRIPDLPSAPGAAASIPSPRLRAAQATPIYGRSGCRR
jgi:hypothetical protein